MLLNEGPAGVPFQRRLVYCAGNQEWQDICIAIRHADARISIVHRPKEVVGCDELFHCSKAQAIRTKRCQAATCKHAVAGGVFESGLLVVVGILLLFVLVPNAPLNTLSA